MNEKNILSLKTRLMQLGFEPSVETLLRCNICFLSQAFDLLFNKQVGKDSFQFSVHLEKGEADLYELRYYTATLRRYVVVPIELVTLSDAMQLVDWSSLLNGKVVPGQIDNSSIQKAFEILGKLQNAGTAADLLKYKYWLGTPLESMILQLADLKNEWEIAERFYFFDENLIITFNDAVRFLSSRWMEKQMVARKKLLVKKTVNDRSSGSAATGKLLSKNQRRLTKRIIDKP